MMTGDGHLSEYDGVPCSELEAHCGSPSLVVVAQCESTMDLAHALAARSALPHGAAVVAGAQTSGRGRSGRAWASASDAGVWVTVLLRNIVEAPVGLLSLRVGLALADRLDCFAGDRIGLKWPNDLFIARAKVGGVLAEARWRGAVVEWTAVGVGINVRRPETLDGAALRDGTRRADVLVGVVRAVLEAAALSGPLTDSEVRAFAARDVACGRRIVAPVAGEVLGITSHGALRVRTDDGVTELVAGSMVFETSGQE